MTTSVYSSRPLLMASNQDLQMLNSSGMRKVKRTLFGPVDHQATQKFIDDELKKIVVTKSEIWNFDFKNESTLNPDGIFEWNPATPKKQFRLIKRRSDTEMDNSDQYCQIPEVELVTPTPVKCSPTHKTLKIQKQSNITDFMKTTKKSTTELSKKRSSPDWNTDVPTKRTRLDIAS